MSRSSALLAVLLGLGAVPATAQDRPAPDSIALAPLRVDAVRATVAAGGASALEITPRAADLTAAPSLETVLRSMPLVTVRTNSRGEAQFSLRGSGSDARQVAVLMEGVPLSVGWDHRTDLGVLPAGAASSVRLLRGVPSLLYGPNVLGGVVMLDVADDVPHRAEADASVDHVGGWSAAARAAGGHGGLSVRGGGGMRSLPGFALPGGVDDASGGDARIGDTKLRTNTDARQVDAFASARYLTQSGFALSLTTTAATARRGIAPELHVSSPRFWRYPEVDRAVAALRAETGMRASPLGGSVKLELSAGIDAASTMIESYANAAYDSITAVEDAQDRTLSTRFAAEHTLGARSHFRVAATAVDTRRDERIDDVPQDYRQRVWSLGAEAGSTIATPFAGRDLLVSVGAVADGADTPLSGDKPSHEGFSALGARAGLTLNGASGTVHFAASRRSRFPSLRELYSGALGRFEPNPGLEPETLNAAEAGVTQRAGRVELQLVGFYRRLDDAIEQIVLESGRRQRVNIGQVRSTGIELLAAAHLRSVDAAVDLTLQRVTEHGALATENADYQPGASGGVHARVRLPAAFAAHAHTRMTSAQYCTADDGGEQRMAPTIRHDAGIARTFSAASRNVELAFDVDNIAGAAIYDQCGLPQPGRMLRLHLRLR